VFHPSDLCMNFEGELRRVSYAARKLDISEEHVKALVAEGSLEYVNVASAKSRHREIRFTDEQLDNFAKQRTRRVHQKIVVKPVKAKPVKATIAQGGSFAERFRTKYGE
jgi:hypothetical protein